MGKRSEEARLIGELIRKERESLSVSKEELSRRIPISKSHLGNIEAGRTLVTVPVLAKIYKVFKTRGCNKSLEQFVQHFKTHEELVEELWKARKMDQKISATRELPFEAKEEILRDMGLLART